MDLVLRKAEQNETAFLQEFSREVINKNYRTFLGDEAVDFFIGSGASDQYIAENINETLVAELDNKIVGICVCKENLIDLIMVKTELHGKNIGSTMLNQVSAELFQNYETIHLESFEANVKANRFYEKNGWEIDKTEADAETGGKRIYYSKRRAF